MTQEELNEVLEQHKLWVKDPTEGERANLERAKLEGANLYGAYLEGANLYGAYLYGANLRGANLYGAYLEGADLRGANLYGANLYEADLYKAYLEGANLERANLRGANLYGAKGLITFQCGQHIAYFTYNNHIKIGCEYHTISHWIDYYKEIGKENLYSKSEIKEYGHFIKRCKKLQEKA